MKRKTNLGRRRKNFLPTLLLAILSWSLWGWFIYSFAPTSNFLLFTFYSLLFGAVFLTSALIFANSRLGSLTALFVVLVLLFRYLQLGNLLNLLLLVGIFLSLGFYFGK